MSDLSSSTSPAMLALTEGLGGLEEALEVVGREEGTLNTFMFEFTVGQELNPVSLRRMFMSIEDARVNSSAYWAGLPALVSHLHQNVRAHTQPSNVTGCCFVMQWPERGFTTSVYLSFVDFSGEVIHRLLPSPESPEQSFTTKYLGLESYSAENVWEVKLPYILGLTAGESGAPGMIGITFEGFEDGLPFSMFSAEGLAFSRLADRVREGAPAELLDAPVSPALLYSSFILTELCKALAHAKSLTLGVSSSGRVLRYVP